MSKEYAKQKRLLKRKRKDKVRKKKYVKKESHLLKVAQQFKKALGVKELPGMKNRNKHVKSTETKGEVEVQQEKAPTVQGVEEALPEKKPTYWH